jgi:hypothetical protein
MVEYLKIQFQNGKINEAYLDKMVAKGLITAEQKIEIINSLTNKDL